MNFSHSIAIRKIIAVYKDILQGNIIELPPYALELPDDVSRGEESSDNRPVRLRNDSYLGAIHKENLLVRAGMQVSPCKWQSIKGTNPLRKPSQKIYGKVSWIIFTNVLFRYFNKDGIIFENCSNNSYESINKFEMNKDK